MAMHVLGTIPEYKKTLILVDPMKKRSRKSLNVRSWRQAYKLVAKGGALVVFPAGAVSHYRLSSNKVLDPDWSPHIASLARRTGATVFPIFIHGRNNFLFQITGTVSRRLQNLLIFKQLPKMRNRSLSITVGKPLVPESWTHIGDDETLSNHFRDHVEILDRT